MDILYERKGMRVSATDFEYLRVDIGDQRSVPSETQSKPWICCTASIDSTQMLKLSEFKSNIAAL